MGRIVVTLLVACVTSLTSASVASAAPSGGCPPRVSGFSLYEFHGEPGDPVPAPGEDPLWDLEVAGALEEGFSSIEEGLRRPAGPERNCTPR